MRYQVVPVRALKDNYIWLLRDGKSAAVVDPGEAAPVLDILAAERLELAAILLTHHHRDHTGGVAGLLEIRRVPVLGPRGEPIEHLTRQVSEGDQVEVPEIGASFQVLDVPGHTRAHIAYYGEKTLFCGDTLFACGCGRVFEGTSEQLFQSLQKLAALPDDTRVYCARIHPGEHRICQGSGTGQRGTRRPAARRCRSACPGAADRALDPGARKGHQPVPALRRA